MQMVVKLRAPSMLFSQLRLQLFQYLKQILAVLEVAMVLRQFLQQEELEVLLIYGRHLEALLLPHQV